jgi:cysteine desulfurase/selenocysteine lyase
MHLSQKCRADFPIFRNPSLIYFDTAATAQKPQSVIDAMTQFYTSEYGTVHRAVYQLAAGATQQYNAVREKVAAFLGARFSDEIIFTRGTTEAINLVACAFGRTHLRAGDEVIISETEHHSNIVPWQMICAERGAHLKVIPVNDRSELLLEEYDKLLTGRTKIVSIAHMANATGTIHPIAEIIRRAHKKGAVVMIDGAQSAPHLPVNVHELDADFYAFSGHKAFGPTGVGVLYAKRELLKTLPPIQGGGDMIRQVTFEKTTYQEPPLRFEAGTPMIAEVIGLGAALDYIESLGRTEIAKWEHELLAYATGRMLEIEGLKIIGTAANKGPIISFAIEGVHPLDLGTLLDLQGIALRTGHLCAQPALKRFGLSEVSRISFGPYNTLEEVDLFITTLKRLLPKLR